MRFLYCYSKDYINKENLISISDKVFSSKVIHEFANSVFIVEDKNLDRYFHSNKSTYGLLNGYTRNYSLTKDAKLHEHNSTLLLALLAGNWPLSDDFTGTFSAISFDNTKKHLVIANDPLGIYPIYYYQSDNKIIISSSIILIGAVSKEDTDEVDLIQSLSGPDYCNYGKRTIVEKVSSLLPGEFLDFSLKELKVNHKKYDIRFYQKIEKSNLQSAVRQVVDFSKKEYEIALRFDNDINIALSGGLDSRFMLSVLPDKKNINCITYGDRNHYETEIANRCASISDNRFTNYPINPNLQLPDINTLSRYVLSTEATGVSEWFSILENIDKENQNKTILLGDMCEAIVGRNLRNMKKLKINDLFNILLKRPIDIKDTKEFLFDDWKNEISNQVINNLLNNGKNSPSTTLDEFILSNKIKLTKEEILYNCKQDLEGLFNIIEQHKLDSTSLNKELFYWYTHGRITMSRQILQANSVFHSISPNMSTMLMCKISNIDPNLRVFGQLMNAVIKTTKYSTLPTASVPFFSQRKPLVFLILMNFIRYKIDVFLTRRIIKNKNAKLRYRLLNSINWSTLYHFDSFDLIIEKWFIPNQISVLAIKCVEIIKKRKNNKSWPLSTLDVTSIASVNIQINLINKLKSYKELR
jgi:hypothetical protein